MLLELENARHYIAFLSEEQILNVPPASDSLASVLGKFGFVIERVNLTDTGGHKEKEDTFRFGGMMQPGDRALLIRTHQISQSDRAKSSAQRS